MDLRLPPARAERPAGATNPYAFVAPYEIARHSLGAQVALTRSAFV
jgi:hypothetical protein